MHRLLEGRGYTDIVTRNRAELDLLDQRATEDFLASTKPAVVIVAAARVGGILANNTYRAEFIYENLALQNNVIHGSYNAGVGKLLFLGSSCIYPREAPQPIREDYMLTAPLEPTNEPYAIAKIAGIKMCQAYNDQYGVDYLSVMPTNLYGPYDNFDLDTSHVLPALIRKLHLAKLLAEGKNSEIAAEFKTHSPAVPEDITAYLAGHGVHSDHVELWGTGSPRREFMHVDDMAAASLHVLEHHTGNELINIGTGTDVSIRELASLIAEIVGYEGEIRWDPSYPDGTPRKLLDVSRLHNLGWDHPRELGTGIREAYQWYLERIERVENPQHV